MFEAVEGLVEEHAELEHRLADPGIHADQGLAKRLNQRYAELSAIVRTYREWQQLGDDIGAARELATEDPSFADEAEQLAARRDTAEERLRHLLVPRDAADAKDAILEIKSGEGGEESALFAGDLLRMYTRYAERRGWKVEPIDATESDLGGYKSVTVAVKAKGTPEPGEAPYGLLKFEGGVHRVQRVPVTESQGRVHTSAAGVLVTPEAEPVDVTIEDKDLRIDVYRSSGPGGQSVNTTDSAVRVTHLPTGIVASCQNEKSQLQNKEQALRILRSRLLQAAKDAADAEASDARRSQVRTVDRSERIRTYNFPENRISDHRTGYKAYNLDAVLGGRPRARRRVVCAGRPVGPAGGPGVMTARRLVQEAEDRLRAAGVASPEHDARELLAHVLGTTRSGLVLIEKVDPAAADRFADLVTRRAAREPLQHLTGTAAFRYAELAVGPGVFVPRPETEVLAGWGVDRARELVAAGRVPVVADLCTGSGAMALSLAQEVPEARVHAVELDECASGWAARNLAGSGVDLRQGDMAEAFADLDGTVDVIVCNPPYIPLVAYESVEAEARDHDPALALWSGEDGLEAMRVLEQVGARLLRPGGVLGAEHAEVQGESAPAVFARTGRWADVRDNPDLAGRSRFVTARLAR